MTRLKNIFLNIILLLLSSILFFFANPNFIITQGIGVLAFIYYVPLLILVNNIKFKTSFLWGFFYGLITNAIYVNWLINFHIVGYVSVVLFYGFLWGFVFFILKLVNIYYSNFAWIVQWLVLCSFEYLKTKGFCGFSYGVTAYTQWKNIYFIQIANIVGVYGVNMVVIFSSALIYSFIYKFNSKKKYIKQQEKHFSEKINSAVKQDLSNTNIERKISLKFNCLLFLLWGFLVCVIIIFGKSTVKNDSTYPTIQVAAIQNNEHAWDEGIDAYSKNIQDLINLTNEALDIFPNINLVVWPETSVVPAIVYHYTQNVDKNRHKLITYLLNFINSKDCNFLIGNGHYQIEKNGSKTAYNSALFFTCKENVIPPKPQIYSKIHLVPFSEYFPYQTSFSYLYNKLTTSNLQMWQPGKEFTIFNIDGFKFSTPICFEDNFPEISRNMFIQGSRCFVNISNDSWANSKSSQYQHLAMAVFRSVENRVPSVRSSSSGQTCIIDQYGRIQAMCNAFTKSFVVGEIPIMENTLPGFYSCHGDFMGYWTCIITCTLLIIRLFIVIIIKNKSKKKSVYLY